jgi:hypothetical protein
MSPTAHLRNETNAVSETFCSFMFLEYRTMDQVQKRTNPECLHHCQNPSESIYF